ncbi:MAG: hypothetical protein M1813_007718 [Trichoglossum hirsutum]|nr:MAG: hypothetical protein M1813_007718 [Trichoglossum hirsutum]
MGPSLRIDELHLPPVAAVNATTHEWGLEALPTVRYIRQGQSLAVGNISTVSFIYLMLSFLIVLLVSLPFIDWIKRAIKLEHPYKPPDRVIPTLPPQAFRIRLSKIYPPITRSPFLEKSYAETIPRQPEDKITSQDLRECRELIRAKFALDVDIYNHRDSSHSRDFVEDMKRRSVGALGDIKTMVEEWERRKRGEWSREERKLVREIHRRLKPLLEKEPEFGGDTRRSEESSELSGLGEDESDDEPEETIRTGPPTAGLPTAGPPLTGPLTVAPHPRSPLLSRGTSIANRLQNMLTRTPTNPSGTAIPELPTQTRPSPSRRSSIIKRIQIPFVRTTASNDIEIAELPPQTGPGPYELS